MKREMRIIVETERSIEVGGDNTDEDWCDKCGDYAAFLPVEIAAGMASVGTGAICHWIENAEFHFRVSKTRVPRICQKSFLEYLRRLNFLPKPKPAVPVSNY